MKIKQHYTLSLDSYELSLLLELAHVAIDSEETSEEAGSMAVALFEAFGVREEEEQPCSGACH